MKTDAQEFVGILFMSRDYAHSAHLNTSSFSQHMALNAFYDEIIELADKFSEAYMGRTGKKIGPIAMIKSPEGEPDKVLRRHMEVIEDTRDFVDAKDTPLNNIVDEIVGVYLSTLYKLDQLK
jgi:glycerophosphoryl diester phosphodiesterase